MTPPYGHVTRSMGSLIENTEVPSATAAERAGMKTLQEPVLLAATT